jgi:CelD/BcsL family acetyltransferase involved in cellulose biosynthesis
MTCSAQEIDCQVPAAIKLDKSHDVLIEDFLKASDQATVYHSPEWRDAVVDTYGYKPIYLGCIDDGRLSALMPMMLVESWLTGRRLVSLPFSNTCGPIGRASDTAALVEEALRVYKERNAKALEIRTQPGVNRVDDDRFTGVNYFITSIVKLYPDPDRVWKSFKDRNVRTEVRQARKKGVETRAGETEEDLRLFYNLFAASRLRHGVPCQPYVFFRNLWRHMAPQYLDLILATVEGRVAGGLITLGLGKTLCAAYIGSDSAFRSRRVHQLMFWKAMEMGCERGFESFDFLRTPKSSASLRYFKTRWGAYEEDLTYLYHPEVAGTASTVEDSAKYAIMTTVLKRSPLFVGKILGRLLYRHLG